MTNHPNPNKGERPEDTPEYKLGFIHGRIAELEKISQGKETPSSGNETGREETENAKCEVCRRPFERSTDPDRRYISCPKHSFGEVVTPAETTEREEERLSCPRASSCLVKGCPYHDTHPWLRPKAPQGTTTPLQEKEECYHQCSGNCRRVGCNCECGEWHEPSPTAGKKEEWVDEVCPKHQPLAEEIYECNDCPNLKTPSRREGNNPPREEEDWEERFGEKFNDTFRGELTDFIRQELERKESALKEEFLDELITIDKTLGEQLPWKKLKALIAKYSTPKEQ